MRFAALEAAEEDTLDVSSEGEARAHAHGATSTTTGPLLTWIDAADFYFFWNRPVQQIVVKRTCSAR